MGYLLAHSELVDEEMSCWMRVETRHGDAGYTSEERPAKAQRVHRREQCVMCVWVWFISFLWIWVSSVVG